VGVLTPVLSSASFFFFLAWVVGFRVELEAFAGMWERKGSQRRRDYSLVFKPAKYDGVLIYSRYEDTKNILLGHRGRMLLEIPTFSYMRSLLLVMWFLLLSLNWIIIVILVILICLLRLLSSYNRGLSQDRRQVERSLYKNYPSFVLYIRRIVIVAFGNKQMKVV
jgi:hypothetical protein